MINPIYASLDLTSGEIKKIRINTDYFIKYVGGKALACRLLLDLTVPGLDPLAPEAALIINTGPMNGTGAPSSSRFNLTFKNVLTGGIASSNSGGQFGVMLKRAGYDGLIITGKAEKPSLIEIVDGNINVRDAGDLWGLNMEESQARLPAHYGKLVIGQAGENLVHYASATAGERMAGRCGSGAVLGSKNIKAIMVYGTKRPIIHNPKKYDSLLRKWTHFLRSHPMTGEALPRYGSAGLVNKANASSALPTHNFKTGHFPEADKISGETLAETLLTRNGSCISCPIRCERRVKMDNREIKGPEFETLGLFGSNIESGDLEKIIRLNYLCDTLGMDTISAASTLAFAMELKERDICDFGVEFGNADNLADAILKIAHREGKFSELANGTKWLSEKYGGKEFAMHAKGLELASYEPRRSVGMGLGYATANRGGCHLNGGYMALFESVGVLMMDSQTPKAKAEYTVFMQNVLEAVSSAGFCLFTSQASVPAPFFKLGPTHPITIKVGELMAKTGWAIRGMLHYTGLLRVKMPALIHPEILRAATGLPYNLGSFIEFGSRCYNIERMYNVREGLVGDTLPGRLLKTPQVEGREDTVVPLDQMLPQYYALRGWDENGAPTPATLNKLGIN